MTNSIYTTKPVLRKSVAFWLCQSQLAVVMGDDVVWLPRLGWSCVSKNKAYENWKLAVTGGDLSTSLEYVKNPKQQSLASGLL